jgi:hypothetical protein
MDNRTDKKRGLVRFTAMAGALSLFVPTAAQAEQDGSESFWLRIDGYRPNVDSSVKIGNPVTGQEGTLIDLESDLSLRKRKTLPSIAAGFSIGDSWQVNGEFYELARKGSIILDEEIEFDGAVYPVSANVESQFSSKIYRLTVGYLVSKGDNHQLGVSVGAHITEFAGSLAGEIAANGSSAQIATRRREVLAPLPTLGIYGSVEPIPRVILGGRADYLSLKVNDYKGRLLNLEVSAGYRLSDKLTMGVGYRRVDYRLKVDKPKWNGEIDYKFDGPSLFMRIGF